MDVLNGTNEITLNAEQRQLITTELAWYYRIIPLKQSEKEQCFLVDESQQLDLIKEELEVLFGKTVVLKSSASAMIAKALATYYPKVKDPYDRLQVIQDPSQDEFLMSLIYEAGALGSSDIHIEPFEEHGRIRIRIDGRLVERYHIDKLNYPGLINKIKIQAHLDIAQKRLPQDGRILIHENKCRYDLRVSIIPTLYGEKAVLRILNQDASQLDIVSLGMGEEEHKILLSAIQKPNGIVLISGPTGSGKTTTLYAALKTLNQSSRNILTIEDPVEYTLEGINQVQLREDIGLSFPVALRTFLRQDPDVIMVGEIRDEATAEMAVRAALTGHLVLSTIHTNSALSTISRLYDMGIPEFLLAETLNISIAQRLLRKLCTNCKKEMSIEQELLPENWKIKIDTMYHFVAMGCEHCYYTGYTGRTAIFEMLPVDDQLAAVIRSKSWNEYLCPNQNQTLSQQAFKLYSSGITSLEEAMTMG